MTDNLTEIIEDINQFFIEKNGIKSDPPILEIMDNNKENSGDWFNGYTGHYKPGVRIITLYTDGRHLRDIISTYCHELIHWRQELQGKLGGIKTDNIEEDSVLKELESEAYRDGGLLLRSYKDNIKQNGNSIEKRFNVNEGRYDKISNEISSSIFNYWKDNLNNTPNQEIEFSNNFINNDIDIDVEATLYLSDEYNEMETDGGFFVDENLIEIICYASIDMFPKNWENLSFELKDIVRHEIEHTTHSENSVNIIPSKLKGNDKHLRDIMEVVNDSKSYFLLPKEIDANIQGLYFRAKKQKRPLLTLMKEYLMKNNINGKDSQYIIETWRSYGKGLSIKF
jgi:hypothetical protein